MINLFLTKVSRQFSKRKVVCFFNKCCSGNWVPTHQKEKPWGKESPKPNENKNPTQIFTAHTKINSKWITDLNERTVRP